MFYGLDVLAPLTQLAPRLHGQSFAFAMRYLKNLTHAEVEALHAGKLALGLIFEVGADNAFLGEAQGKSDGHLAAHLARVLGASAGCAIFATVDRDVTGDIQLEVVGEYLAAFGEELGEYHLGIYACGAVLRRFGDDAVRWLPGATGWSGSAGYTGWTIKQGPTFSGGNWQGIQWGGIGIPYDPNLAIDLAWAWAYDGGVEPAPPRPPTLRQGDQSEAVGLLQTALNHNPLAVDADFGAATEYAVRSFQVAHGLTPDGVVGPKTWAALTGKTDGG